MSQQHQTDVLVIGSGAAGLSLALRLAKQLRVHVLSKGPVTEGSTLYAQGGVSAVLDDEDSFDSHIEDTLNAGAGLCDPQVVRHVVENGPAAIDELLKHGVSFSEFTKQSGESTFHLTREGGHTHRRVIHSADATGHAIETALVGQAEKQASLTLLDHHIAIDLITGDKLRHTSEDESQIAGDTRIRGVYAFNRKTRQVETISARFVILATGGASKVYLYTSNPDISTGDGIAMAWRAGCRVGNMEFIQFHPTCLYHPKAKSFLMSEALRGEGAYLVLPDGERFMSRYDERAELAPRDIVARAIDHEMKRLGIENVYLDISHKPDDFIKQHFPTIHQRCEELGYDLCNEPIPVVPAAHYTCGGVMVDLHGRTDVEGLYAIGEVAFSGLHGANRMASNSLLECLVYADATATDILKRIQDQPQAETLPRWDESRVTDSDEMVVVTHNWDELRRFMWDYVGIVRSTKRLQRAQSRIRLLRQEIDDYYGNFRISNDLIELRNLAKVADLIVRSALLRRESRGLHYTLDHPEPNQQTPPTNTILVPKNFAARQRPPRP